MPHLLKVYGPRLFAWFVISLVGSVLLARNELAQLREAFETDARISHRLLSQRVVQQEAVLATLVLLQPPAPPGGAESAEQRLSSVYPQILSVQRRDAGAAWPDPSLDEAEKLSRQTRAAVLANPDFRSARGRYQLVLAAQPASYALLIDIHGTIPWSDWSMPVQTSPVRVTLEHAGQAFVVQAGRITAQGWRFAFRKHLDSQSQPFDVVALRQVGWQELPWLAMALWTFAVAAVLAAWSAWQRQRSARRRAEALLRVGQVARLNTLGELAAGMAHELNQPLTAILANTQAAKRLLQDDPGELPTALQAMDQAVAQARRATEVLGRLRRTVEQAAPAATGQTVDLAQAVRSALDLLEPECQRRGVVTSVHIEQPARVLAERVALEQIVHNLITNALQALDSVPASERQLAIHIGAAHGMGVLRVVDTGPGITPDTLPHVFEPFFTTREGGLGLGLSLCETLASGMGGQLRAQANVPRGAIFVLTLPLANRP
ncbi:ATP-binding protein [Rhodoferax sp.]|uniref:sensor histidine kinase n=1 Tax=Rhodoferax sp. TaxID=50421 RepID=UPI0025D0F5F5|nr:ATP-binding protein [Rhodoferax sp.]MCM2340580.1 ATP-binding protein [Rhodoferax sp.]